METCQMKNSKIDTFQIKISKIYTFPIKIAWFQKKMDTFQKRISTMVRTHGIEFSPSDTVWYMTLTAEYYQQCCYLIYLLLPMQSGSQTNWESVSVFPLRSTHILALVRALQWCTQAGSPGQIKADSQCWCLVLLFLFPSFSEAALSSETPLNFFSPTFYFFSPNPPNFSPIPLQISSKP